jgi:F1F0 ATPase subunit 2
MSETLTLAMAWVAGCVLGAIFYGGLWWTVRKGVSSKKPALWFFSSLLVRVSLTLAGFYFASGSGRHWERLLFFLLGFVMARVAVTRMTRENQTHPAREVSHAP